MKARWSHMMWMANEAMNGTLSENLEKNLDEAWERDSKIMRMLCGEIAAQDATAPVDDNDSFPELPFYYFSLQTGNDSQKSRYY